MNRMDLLKEVQPVVYLVLKATVDSGKIAEFFGDDWIGLV